MRHVLYPRMHFYFCLDVKRMDVRTCHRSSFSELAGWSRDSRGEKNGKEWSRFAKENPSSSILLYPGVCIDSQYMYYRGHLVSNQPTNRSLARLPEEKKDRRQVRKSTWFGGGVCHRPAIHMPPKMCAEQSGHGKYESNGKG